MTATRQYIAWDHPSVESVPAHEAETIQRVVKQVNLIQAAQATGEGKEVFTHTGTHAKTHGIVKGTITIAEDLPTHLKQSMFANPGTYSLIMRYSSEPGVPLLDDRIQQPRGLGIKIFGIEGEKLHGRDVSTQDLEFNSCSILELANAKVAEEIINLRITLSDPQALSDALDKREDGPTQQIRNHMLNQRLESLTQYSQSAFRFGDYVAKFCVVSTGAIQVAQSSAYVKSEHSSTILREWLTEFYAHNAGTYELRVQLLENIDEQPVEDSRIEWNEVKYPFTKVATINIPSQDCNVAERNSFWAEQLRVDPWHGLKTLQPLGSINRTRKHVYQASSDFRRAANGVKEFTATVIDQIP